MVRTQHICLQEDPEAQPPKANPRPSAPIQHLAHINDDEDDDDDDDDEDEDDDDDDDDVRLLRCNGAHKPP